MKSRQDQEPYWIGSSISAGALSAGELSSRAACFCEDLAKIDPLFQNMVSISAVDGERRSLAGDVDYNSAAILASLFDPESIYISKEGDSIDFGQEAYYASGFLIVLQSGASLSPRSPSGRLVINAGSFGMSGRRGAISVHLPDALVNDEVIGCAEKIMRCLVHRWGPDRAFLTTHDFREAIVEEGGDGQLGWLTYFQVAPKLPTIEGIHLSKVDGALWVCLNASPNSDFDIEVERIGKLSSLLC